MKQKRQEIRQRRKTINVKPTKLMCMCFVFEFCNRWVMNAFDSRYGYYLKDKFGVGVSTFTIIICSQSVLLCIEQAWLYSVIVYKLGVPIPIVALCGGIIELLSYFFMGFCKTLAGNIVASTFLWIGYVASAPTSSSIISTTNEPEVQGKVLSWNNLSGQSSLILSPLILSAIYNHWKEGTYYYSMILAVGSISMMSIVLTMPGAKQFGKEKKTVLPVVKKEAENSVVHVEKKEEKGNESGEETKEESVAKSNVVVTP